MNKNARYQTGRAMLCGLLCLGWVGSYAAASNLIETPEQVQAGSLLFRTGTNYRPATRLNTDISIEASGLVARTKLRQRFRNDGPDWVEGTYVFPLPEKAAVDRMRIEIGERLIEGEIREREQAKREYQAAVRAGRKAGLVDQQRANLFTTSIANIAPGETVVVEIEYLDAVNYQDSQFSLRVPMTLTPRYIPGSPVADRQGSGWSPDTDQVADASLITPPMVFRAEDLRVTLKATIKPGLPLQFVASRYHPIDVSNQGEAYRISFADTDVPMDHDLELIWQPVPSIAPRALSFVEEINEEYFMLVMLVPPDDADGPMRSMPREMVFVIDTSGSMQGVSIEQARAALLLALDGLQPSDRFNVIQFSSHTQTLFGAPVFASTQSIRQAKRYVQRLKANGGTEMAPALSLALQTDLDEAFLRQVIFITDGSVGNEEGLFRIIERELGGARLFTVGIGSAPNGWFMHKAAELGRGSYTFISALHEVDERMTRLFTKLEHPQLIGVEVRWPDNLEVDVYPPIVPDLYSGEPVVLRASLSRSVVPGDTLAVGGLSPSGKWEANLALDSSQDARGVAALWARARITELENRRRRGADPDKTRKQILSTALAHKLVSKHTSLVAVDKTPSRPESMKLARESLANRVPHGQSAQALNGFATTATAAPAKRWAGLLLIAAALLLAAIGVRRERPCVV